MVDFRFALTELFAIYYGSEATGRNVYGSAVFTGVDLRPLCTQIYLNVVVPSNHSWYYKTRDTGLSDDKDCISLLSLILTQHWSVTDRQTDMPCRSIGLYSACKALRRAVKL